MNDILIWFLIFLVLIIILGLYFSQETPLNLSEKDIILNKKLTIENFNPLVSSMNDISEGASELYKWGLPDDKVKIKKCSKPTPDPIPPFKPHCITKKETCCDNDNDNDKNASYPNCFNSDITKNKDINKYVLKSSVPACPDTSKYATKNMVQSCPDLNNYIMKSHIPSCPKVDLSQYILKNEIASCPKCPICPICPICPTCPTCPPQKKCKTIKNYSISEHPDFKNYIHKDNVSNECIKKTKTQKARDELIKKCHSLEEEEYLYPNQHNSNNKNNKYNNNCDKYPPIVDRVFDKKHIKPFSNPDGVYAGDSLFAAV